MGEKALVSDGREKEELRREGERWSAMEGFCKIEIAQFFYNFKFAPLKSEQTEKNLIEPQLTDKEVLR